MNLLHIDSSITGNNSVTRQRTAAIVQRCRDTTPGLKIVRRDLANDPLPYFAADTLADAAAQPRAHQADARLDRIVLNEFIAADVIVIGAPMYNFAVPAQLKSWIDYLAVAGVTFSYTAEGPVGLAGGKTVYIASARGGIYSEGPAAGAEHQLSRLTVALRFFGITDIHVLQAEGMKISDDAKQDALDRAFAQIAALPAPTV